MAHTVGFILSVQEEADHVSKLLFPREVAHREILVRTVLPNEISGVAEELIQSGAQALIARAAISTICSAAACQSRW